MSSTDEGWVFDVPRRIMLVGVLGVSLFASNVAGAETLMMTCTQWLEVRQRPDQGASTPEMAHLISKFRAQTFVVADSIDAVCRKWPFLLWEPALRIALRLTRPDCSPPLYCWATPGYEP